MEMFQDQRIFGSRPRNVQPSSLIRCEVNLKNLATGTGDVLDGQRRALPSRPGQRRAALPRDRSHLSRSKTGYVQPMPTSRPPIRTHSPCPVVAGTTPGPGWRRGFPQYTSKGGLLGARGLRDSECPTCHLDPRLGAGCSSRRSRVTGPRFGWTRRTPCTATRCTCWWTSPCVEIGADWKIDPYGHGRRCARRVPEGSRRVRRLTRTGNRAPPRRPGCRGYSP